MHGEDVFFFVITPFMANASFDFMVVDTELGCGFVFMFLLSRNKIRLFVRECYQSYSC